MVMSVEQFKECAESAGGTFIGRYDGRFYHKGVAATFKDTRDLMNFGAALHRAGLSIPGCQVDTFGTGIVVSFEQRAFDACDVAAIPEYEDVDL